MIRKLFVLLQWYDKCSLAYDACRLVPGVLASGSDEFACRFSSGVPVDPVENRSAVEIRAGDAG